MDRVKEEISEKGGISNLGKMGWKLFYNFGITGVVNYIKGFSGIGTYGIYFTSDFYNSLITKNYISFTSLFTGSKRKNFQKIELIYTNKKIVYDSSNEGLNLFWQENVAQSGSLTNLTIDNNNIFNSGYNIAGAFKLNSGSLVINAVFIHTFQSEIKSIKIWIDAYKS